MNENFSDKECYDKTYSRESVLRAEEYENCRFNNCDFSGLDLSSVKFLECEFTGCNLTLPKTVKTVFSRVQFKECKLLGLRFDQCNEFGLIFRFENCLLDQSSFYKTKIKKTVFKKSQLHEVDFAECDLSGAVFDDCDLLNARFEYSIMEKADFRSAYNYSIDPERNKIRKARFSLSGAVRLLDKYDIEVEE